MSYILDALKKAEAERKLGSVPDLNAQSVETNASDGKPALWNRPPVWIILAMLASALGTFIWLKSWQAAPAAVATTQSASAQPLSTQQPSPTMAAAPPPAVEAVQPATSPPAVAAAQPATSPPVKSMPAEPVKRKAEPKSEAKARERKQPEPALASVAPPVIKPQPAPAAAPMPEKLPTLRELPENIQREIPPLAIGGYIYSSNQAERSILINNRLLREGEQAAPGLTLEKMMPREVVLSYRGYRYRIAY